MKWGSRAGLHVFTAEYCAIVFLWNCIFFVLGYPGEEGLMAKWVPISSGVFWSGAGEGTDLVHRMILVHTKWIPFGETYFSSKYNMVKYIFN